MYSHKMYKPLLNDDVEKVSDVPQCAHRDAPLYTSFNQYERFIVMKRKHRYIELAVVAILLFFCGVFVAAHLLSENYKQQLQRREERALGLCLLNLVGNVTDGTLHIEFPRSFFKFFYD